MGRTESVGKQTETEFCSEFGAGSCVFYQCDVADSQALTGKNSSKIPYLPLMRSDYVLLEDNSFVYQRVILYGFVSIGEV